MKPFVPDTSSVALDPSAPASVGQKFLEWAEYDARRIYPDHGESRTKLVKERMVTEIDRLTAELAAAKVGRIS